MRYLNDDVESTTAADHPARRAANSASLPEPRDGRYPSPSRKAPRQNEYHQSDHGPDQKVSRYPKVKPDRT